MTQRDPGRAQQAVGPPYHLEDRDGERVRVYEKRGRGLRCQVQVFPEGGGTLLTYGNGESPAEAREAAGLPADRA